MTIAEGLPFAIRRDRHGSVGGSLVFRNASRYELAWMFVRSGKRIFALAFSQESLVLYGFFLVVGGLLLALRARRAAESPQRNNALMLAAVIVMTGLGFWAGSLVIGE